jgi:hypothetical protein
MTTATLERLCGADRSVAFTLSATRTLLHAHAGRGGWEQPGADTSAVLRTSSRARRSSWGAWPRWT